MTCTFPGIGRAAFFDALDSIGGFVEVMEVEEDGHGAVERLREIHLGWDGSDPIRTFEDLFPAH